MALGRKIDPKTLADIEADVAEIDSQGTPPPPLVVPEKAPLPKYKGSQPCPMCTGGLDAAGQICQNCQGSGIV